MFAERIKELRKELGVTQTAFGKKLGVSVDVIKNLEYNRTTPSEIFLDHICEVYHANREYLDGKSDEMFLKPSDDAQLVELLLDQANASPAVRSLLHSWLQLPPDKRKILEDFAEDFAARHQSEQK